MTTFRENSDLGVGGAGGVGERVELWRNCRLYILHGEVKVRPRQTTECCVWSLTWPSWWVSHLISQSLFLHLQNGQNASYTYSGWIGTNRMRIYMKTLCMLLNAIKCILDLLGVFIQLTVTHLPEGCLPCPRMTPLPQLYLLFCIPVLTYPQLIGPGWTPDSEWASQILSPDYL